MKVTLYYRLSKQGGSGLGLEAQRTAVEQFCAARGHTVVGEFTEIESGKNDHRAELAKALHLARVTNSTLVVAKLDRLSRNVAFLAQLQDAGVKFMAVDMPEANELTVHVMAAVAQQERKAISLRTKEALRAARSRGKRLGNPNGAAALRAANKGNVAALSALRRRSECHLSDVAPIIRDVALEGGLSLRQVAAELNARGVVTSRGGAWHAASVRSILHRIQVSGQ